METGKFQQLLESYGMLNTQQRLFYPRNFNLSPEFIRCLKKEIETHCSEKVKNRLPPRMFAQKLNKALLFYVNDYEKMMNMKSARMPQHALDDVAKDVKPAPMPRKALRSPASAD